MKYQARSRGLFQEARNIVWALGTLVLVGLVAVGPLVGAAGPAMAEPAALAHGTVSVDVDRDGVLDLSGPVGEVDVPLPGVTVTLRGSNVEHPGWTTTTGADGSYWFAAGVDRSESPEPFVLSIDLSGVGGDAFAAPTDRSQANAFQRSGGVQRAATESFTAGQGPVALNALVYPTWELDLVLPNADGYGGRAVHTGTAPWDANDSQAGWDSSAANARVRSGDLVSYNWSLTAAAQESLGNSFTDVILEQTLHLAAGAVVNFSHIPARCNQSASAITAYPEGGGAGRVISPRTDPPAGTRRVVLSCNLGAMGQGLDPAPAAVILPTKVFVSHGSVNEAAFHATARAYALTPGGIPVARAAGSVGHDPLAVSAAPRYDVENLAGSGGWVSHLTINGVLTQGLTTYYTLQIAADRSLGIEMFEQPIHLEQSFWAVYAAVAGSQGKPGELMPDLKWYLTECTPSPDSRQGNEARLVHGRVGINPRATALNSVPDSGRCAFVRQDAADHTSNYNLTLSGINASGAAFPTRSVGGSSLEAGPYYVASYRVAVFIPFSEIDKAVGTANDGAGQVNVFNRFGAFDPSGVSGTSSNFASGFEPGYCAAGPNSQMSTACTPMPGGARSNNVAGPVTNKIGAGGWGLYLVDSQAGAWLMQSSANLPGAAGEHTGDGLVQAGQSFTAVHVFSNGGPDLAGGEMCHVFDNSVLTLTTLSADAPAPGREPWPEVYAAVVLTDPARPLNAVQQEARQGEWSTVFAAIDLKPDTPNTGQFHLATNRFEGDWTVQQRATNTTNTVCGSPGITWYSDPKDVPGGVEAVNAAWVRASEGVLLHSGATERWRMAFTQRDSYYAPGTQRHGQLIPAGTVAAQHGAVRTDTWMPSWTTASYIPGAGTTGGVRREGETGSTQGDRWTMTRAMMTLQQRTVTAAVNGVPSTGAAGIGQTGAGVAGRHVVWETLAGLSAISGNPAPIPGVVITQTLPRYVSYNEAATRALAGGTPADSYTFNESSGQTTLVWNLDTLTPNEPIPNRVVVTDTDPFTPTRTFLVSRGEITAPSMVPNPAHRDDHTVVLEQSGELQLKKSVDRTLGLAGATQAYTLQVKNFSETLLIENPVVIEVLPHNGDGSNEAGVNRSPASSFTGTSALAAAPRAFRFDAVTPLAGTFYYTSANPKDVPQHIDQDTDPSIWSTTFTAGATAFKFVAAEPLRPVSGTEGGMTITFTTTQAGNGSGDTYANRFTAFSSTLRSGAEHQLLASNLVFARVMGFSLGDLIWLDQDEDGKFDPEIDLPAPAGVSVEVYRRSGDSDIRVATVKTNEDGRWIANDLPAGHYYAVIPASEFAVGGPLEGGVAVTASLSDDPDTDANEYVDHHAVGDPERPGAVRSAGLIELSANTAVDPITGNEPLRDNTGGLVPTVGTTDDFTNFTLDMAIYVAPRPATLTLVKELSRPGIAPIGARTTNWTVTASAEGHSAISGSGHVSGVVAASTEYALASSLQQGAHDDAGLFIPASTSPWACTYADGSPLPEGTWGAAGSVSVPPGRDVTCIETSATAEITLLKQAEGDSRAPDVWRLGAVPREGAVGTNWVAGSWLDQTGPEQADASNTVALRPGTAYALREELANASKGAGYLLRRVEVWDATAKAGAGDWREVADVSQVVLNPGDHAIYRFVNAPTAGVTLPATGPLGGILLPVVGALLAAAGLALRHLASRRAA